MTELTKETEAPTEETKAPTEETKAPTDETEAPIYKLVNRKWKELTTKGGSVGITDPKLSAGYVGVLTDLTIIELEELLCRQDKLLSNKGFISILKDGGVKISERRENVKAALEMVRNNTLPLNELAPAISMSSYEWTGKVASSTTCNKEKTDKISCNSISEEIQTDPLQLIASHSSDIPVHTKHHESPLCTSEEDPSLIIQKELEKLNIQDTINGSNQNGMKTVENEDFGSKTLRSLEEKQLRNPKKRPPFKPFQLPGNKWKPKADHERNKYLWQESSATGFVGPSLNNEIHLISLRESLELLRKQQFKERERQQNEALRHLGKVKGFSFEASACDFSSSKFSNYRDTNIERHILEGSEDEDEDENIHGSLKLVRSSDEAY